MTTDVQNKIKSCDRCLKRKSSINVRSPLVSIHTFQPLELVCMDYLTLETSKGGHQNILVITDHFTKYAVAIPTRNQQQKQLLRHFSKMLCHIMVSLCFESDLISEMCKLTGMTKSRTTSYHPMGNGICERFNRTLLNMLGTMDPDQKHDWKSHINALVHAYNCTKHSSTQHTPYFLMFGRHPKLPIDALFGIEQNEMFDSQSDFIQNLKTRLKQAYELASLEMQKAQKHQKKNYDKRLRAASLEVGDKVLVKIVKFDGKHKIADRWENEPYVIIKQPNKDIPVYTVKSENPNGLERTLHRNLLLPISSNPIPLARKSKVELNNVDTVERTKVVQNKTNDVSSFHTDSEKDSSSEEQLSSSEGLQFLSDDTSSDEYVFKEQLPKTSEKKIRRTMKGNESGKETLVFITPKFSTPRPIPRRSTRTRKPPLRFSSGDYVMNINTNHRSEWENRAEYIKQLALDNIFVHMPVKATEALLHIVTETS